MARAPFLFLILILVSIASRAGERTSHSIEDLAIDEERLVTLERRQGQCLLSFGALREGARPTSRLPESLCPGRLSRLAGGGVLVASASDALWIASDGTKQEPAKGILAAASRANYVREIDADVSPASGRGGATRTSRRRIEWVCNGAAIPLQSGSFRDFRFLGRSEALLAISSGEGGERIVRIEAGGAVRELVSGVKAIDSYEVSPDEQEMVVSARRDRQFDVAIASTTSDRIKWIESSEGDETRVSWAPRGNKVTWMVAMPDGEVIRTTHVPTGYQLPVALALARARKLVWEPKAERFAVLFSTPASSDQIDLMRYGGDDRVVVRPADRGVNREADQRVVGGLPAVVFPPTTIRYGARAPVIVWTGAEDPLEWGAAGELLADEPGIGMLLVREGVESIGPELWTALGSLPWTDMRRVIVVSPNPVARADLERLARAAPRVTIVGATQGRLTRARRLPRGGRLVLFRAAGADDVEFVAACRTRDLLHPHFSRGSRREKAKRRLDARRSAFSRRGIVEHYVEERKCAATKQTAGDLPSQQRTL